MGIIWDHVKENGWTKRDKDSFRILSIDGGGIKGIFPAKYLAQVEEQTGRPIYEYFDLITGTSTGGIIALALSIGIPAKEIVELYVENGKSIFTPVSILPFIPIKRTGLGVKSKYNNDGLKKILKDTFGEYKIKDAKTMLCIPSIEHDKAQPKVYKTPHNRDYRRDANEYMYNVALATSAAPIFFPAACINDKEHKIDGGLWANNPSCIGIAEAVNEKIDPKQIKVLSIGTGDNTYSRKNLFAKLGGLVSWNKGLIEFIMNVQSVGAHHTSSFLIGKENLKRINFKDNVGLSLDSVKDKNIQKLLLEAERSFDNTYTIRENIEKEFFALKQNAIAG